MVEVGDWKLYNIVYAMRTQMSWTHLRSLMSVKDPLAREFYIEMYGVEHWDTRTFEEKIDGQLFERTAISRRPEDVIKRQLAEVRNNNTIVPDMVFRSTYFLDMLGLPDVFAESDFCDDCIMKSECCGLFSTSKKQSPNIIHPIKALYL